MNQSIIILLLLFLGCAKSTEEDVENNGIMPVGICPHGNHKDQVIPIVYGMPSEEMFAEADSGLIWLGGCEIGEEEWWCKKHEVAF